MLTIRMILIVLWTVEQNSTLLLQLIGNILDLSKIESGTLKFV